MDAISEEETRMGHGDSPPVSSQLSVAVRDTPHTVTMGTQTLVILGISWVVCCWGLVGWRWKDFNAIWTMEALSC